MTRWDFSTPTMGYSRTNPSNIWPLFSIKPMDVDLMNGSPDAWMTREKVSRRKMVPDLNIRVRYYLGNYLTKLTIF